VTQWVRGSPIWACCSVLVIVLRRQSGSAGASARLARPAIGVGTRSRRGGESFIPLQTPEAYMNTHFHRYPGVLKRQHRHTQTLSSSLEILPVSRSRGQTLRALSRGKMRLQEGVAKRWSGQAMQLAEPAHQGRFEDIPGSCSLGSWDNSNR
jgi:hypothetical protein